MRRLALDHSVLLLCLITLIFLSTAVILVVLSFSGIEPSREQILITSVVGPLLPTVTSILALYRVQVSEKKIDVVKESTQKTGQIVDEIAKKSDDGGSGAHLHDSLEKIDAKIDVVNEKADQTKVTVDDLANHTREFKSIDDMVPYLHDNVHEFRQHFQTLGVKLDILIKILEREHGQSN